MEKALSASFCARYCARVVPSICSIDLASAGTPSFILAEAVTEVASRAAEKLRAQSSHAAEVLVFIRTSPFRPDLQYSSSAWASQRPDR